MRNSNYVLFLLIGVVFLTSCAKKTKITQTEKTYLQEYVNSDFDCEYYKGKSRISYDDGVDDFSGTVYIRMKKDSVLWMQVNAVMGIEVAKVLITKDSAFVAQKLPSRSYKAYSVTELSQKMGFNFDLGYLQNYLLGQPIILANVKEEVTESDSLLTVTQKQGDYYISSHIDKVNKHLCKVITGFLNDVNKVTTELSDFEPVSNGEIPMFLKLYVRFKNQTQDMAAEVEIKHIKAECFSEPVSFPFKFDE